MDRPANRCFQPMSNFETCNIEYFTIVDTKWRPFNASLLTSFFFAFQILAGKYLTFWYIQPNIVKSCLGRWSRSFVWRHITKLCLSRLFKENTEGSSMSTHFQTGVRFSSWSRALKLTTLVKIVGQLELPALSCLHNLERHSVVMFSHKRSSAPSTKAWFNYIWLNISKC